MSAKIIKLAGGGNIKVDLSKLEAIEKSLNMKFSSQVGVLGQSVHNRKMTSMMRKKTSPEESGSDLTNADIGAVHEFGSKTRHIPRRSFLEMPLVLKMADELKKNISAISKNITMADIRKAYALLGITAENVIQKAFSTHGFGKWAPNAPYTIAKKGSASPLIDTAQLRKSITSRVVTK